MVELFTLAMMAEGDNGAGAGAILGIIVVIAMLLFAESKTHPK